MFPRRAVSSIVGIGGMAGSLGGVLFPYIVGQILDTFSAKGDITSGYNIIFIMCGSAYLIAWIVMHFFVPRMERVKIS
jgi:ACS family hexuronate transporter-like MFS transporter